MKNDYIEFDIYDNKVPSATVVRIIDNKILLMYKHLDDNKQYMSVYTFKNAEELHESLAKDDWNAKRTFYGQDKMSEAYKKYKTIIDENLKLIELNMHYYIMGILLGDDYVRIEKDQMILN